MSRFDALLRDLPADCIFDGEIVVLDDAGRPHFNALVFGRRSPVYVAFDVLYADGQDFQLMPLRSRKAVLKRLMADRPGVIVMDGIAREGTRLFRAVCQLDLEGIVANRMTDPYGAETESFKIPNRAYSQKVGRAELFR
jgi:bifunctional non-homologous end joining protein LigD